VHITTEITVKAPQPWRRPDLRNLWLFIQPPAKALKIEAMLTFERLRA